MITPAEVRKLALGLPEAVEVDHWGNPSFRVKGKIFATLRVKEKTAVLKMSPEEQSTFGEVHPEAFEKIAWGTQTWTKVHLPKVKKVLLRQLLVSAWRRVAPKKIAALLP
jgi:hypothetical protein